MSIDRTKKKIIRIVHVTTSLKVGGAETVLCDLVSRLDPHLFKQHVIYFHEGPNVDRLAAMGVKLHQVKGLVCRYDPVFCVRLFLLLRTLKPNIIHSLLWSANMYCRTFGRLLGIPVLSVLHNNLDQDGIFRNLIDRCTVMLSSNIVAVSDEVADSLKARDAWIPAARIKTITNGVDVEAVQERGIQFQHCRYEIGLSDEHFVIGSVGRFSPVKNYSLLLESFARVSAAYPLARLVLVGSGPQEQALKNYADDLGVRQQVVFIIGQQAYGYYPLFDCFALASDKEGVSIALLEALSFGLPAVVTNTAPHHVVLQSGVNGLVVEAGSVSALAKGLSRLIVSTELRKTLGANGRTTVERSFNVVGMVNAYESTFLQLCRK